MISWYSLLQPIVLEENGKWTAWPCQKAWKRYAGFWKFNSQPFDPWKSDIHRGNFWHESLNLLKKMFTSGGKWRNKCKMWMIVWSHHHASNICWILMTVVAYKSLENTAKWHVQISKSLFDVPLHRMLHVFMVKILSKSIKLSNTKCFAGSVYWSIKIARIASTCWPITSLYR